MCGAAYEAVFIYCECAATNSLPGGRKVLIHKVKFSIFVLMMECIDNFHEYFRREI